MKILYRMKSKDNRLIRVCFDTTNGKANRLTVRYYGNDGYYKPGMSYLKDLHENADRYVVERFLTQTYSDQFKIVAVDYVY